jgi:hypothetical protein
MKRLLTNQLLFFFLAAVAGQDGSTPEEVCPCQAEDSCQNDRHIFGRDELDIQKFGLIPPCRNSGEIPCCPRDPPPPKETKLTQKDLEGFSPAELAQLGIMPEGTIGSSSLPLAEQPEQSKVIQDIQQPIDITQPGAASIAPHGATGFASSNAPKGHPPHQQKLPYPVQQPNPPPMMQHRPPPPMMQYRPPPPPPPVYQKPVYPTYYTPPPQRYRRPVYNYPPPPMRPMYRPAYQRH